MFVKYLSCLCQVVCRVCLASGFCVVKIKPKDQWLLNYRFKKTWRTVSIDKIDIYLEATCWLNCLAVECIVFK